MRMTFILYQVFSEMKPVFHIMILSRAWCLKAPGTQWHLKLKFGPQHSQDVYIGLSTMQLLVWNPSITCKFF